MAALGICLIVRDEDDIIESNILHHLKQGFDQIVVMDNSSRDETRSILERLVKKHPVSVIDQPDTDYRQDEWATALALRLRDLGVDWAISLDADEFISVEGSLRSMATTFPSHPLICRRQNILPGRSEASKLIGNPVAAALYRVVSPLGMIADLGPDSEPAIPLMLRTMPGKCLFPTQGLRSVHRGGHDVDHENPFRANLAGVLIRHYPIRSFPRFQRKIEHSRQRFDQDQGESPHVSWHLRRWIERDDRAQLRKEHNSFLLSQNQIATLSASGTIVEDDFGPKLAKKIAGKHKARERRDSVAVICAGNSGQNTGMFSVDLAAIMFLRSAGLDTSQITLFNVPMRAPYSDMQANLEYSAKAHFGDIGINLLQDPLNDLSKFERIIYWGDFLHSRRYFGIGLITEDLAYRCMLLEGAPREFLSRVICYGGCLLTNTAADERNTRYTKAVGRLFYEAKSVTCRDPISAALATRYSGYSKPNTLGLDGAFLLDSETLFNRTEEIHPLKTGVQLGYSFGRSADVAAPLNFAKLVAESLNISAVVDIAWNEESPDDDPVTKLGKKIQKIRSCSLIITDTYHCAINCLREGIPTICIGSAASHQVKAIDDKKKEILYMMLNIKDYYVFREAFSTRISLEEEVKRVGGAIQANGNSFKSAIDSWRLALERQLHKDLWL
jgi:hypothetical protein